MNLISEAKELAIKAHNGQFRKFSGEAYVEHPKRVAQIVLKYKTSKHLDSLMAAALLHDVVEDTSITIEEIKEKFGKLIAFLVEELTSDDKIKGFEKAKYLSNKMSNMSSWALAIKLADRLDNVSDLRHVNESFRKKYVEETKYIISNIIKRRRLSLTHAEIISDILKELSGIEKLDEINSL